MREFGTTIFAEMSALAVATGVDQPGPGLPRHRRPGRAARRGRARRSARARTSTRPGPGRPELRAGGGRAPAAVLRARASTRTPRCWSRPGATEAIAAAILALCEPGDEVVTFEPYYDSYAASHRPGRRARAGPCRCAGRTSPSTRRRCGRPSPTRTRLVLLNTPHNPTGKVFTPGRARAGRARWPVEHGAFVVTDEVYEHLVFDGLEHIPMATLPGMAERTLTISSAGKTFSVTGWKVGWVTGPAELVAAVRGGQAVPDLRRVRAVPAGRRRRARAAATRCTPSWPRRCSAGATCSPRVWQRAGFEVSRPGGTYFVVADAAAARVRRRAGAVPGAARAGRRRRRCRSASSATTRTPRASLVRFAFCKQEDVLREAVERLPRLAGWPRLGTARLGAPTVGRRPQAGAVVPLSTAAASRRRPGHRPAGSPHGSTIARTRLDRSASGSAPLPARRRRLRPSPRAGRRGRRRPRRAAGPGRALAGGPAGPVRRSASARRRASVSRPAGGSGRSSLHPRWSGASSPPPRPGAPATAGSTWRPGSGSRCWPPAPAW